MIVTKWLDLIFAIILTEKRCFMASVVKRNGEVVNFDSSKIENAVLKAFIAVEGEQIKSSPRLGGIIASVQAEVKAEIDKRESIHVETIQDIVERALMVAGEHKVARAYVIYRESRATQRAEQANGVEIVNDDGSTTNLTHADLIRMVEPCMSGMRHASASKIATEAFRSLYRGANGKDVQQALRIATRSLIEQDPEYSQVAARLLARDLKEEARGAFGRASGDAATYGDDLVSGLMFGVSNGQIDPRLLSERFDLKALSEALTPERDDQFTFLGLQTLYDRYFLHVNGVRYERPQCFFMRVAMGLALNEHEQYPTQAAIAFYRVLSTFDYMTSTPTLFNSGTLRPQLSSCFLTTIGDDLHQIFSAIRDNAMLSKFSGGIGNDWTQVRGLGSLIKGTNGESQGVVPFLKVANDTAVAVNQGGKRAGAVCAYLETWHIDIEEFLDLRKNTGDDRRRTHDMNTANWIPDLFMRRVMEDGQWTLFSPDDAPDLHDLIGKAFETRYLHYEAMAKEGKIRLFKVIDAKSLWRKMLSMLFETGHPWMTFKDPCNLRSPQQHVGVVHSSNLCTEITLNTSRDEIAVCNLGSVNLAQHIDVSTRRIDHEKLRQTVRIAVRMLDNVVDINYYTVDSARNSNLRHRPVGLGLMGFQDALYLLDIAYASEKAVEFADLSMELISYYAIEASHELAMERGSYGSFEGSLWSQGVLPIDSIEILSRERGEGFLDMDRSATLDWAPLREKVKKGMRNSNVMAIAPTATISNICGVNQSIEPIYQNLYVKSNMSGDFTVINPYLVRELKNRDLWDDAMVNDLKFNDGSVQEIDRIPQDLKEKYRSAFEVEPRWLIDAASRRQKWLDQAQSLNLYMTGVSGKKLDLTYRMAWYKGLKTTYYLRSMGATSAEKSTINTGKLNAVSAS